MYESNRDYFSFEACGRCRGQGHFNGRCEVCGGEGKVMVAQPAEPCEVCDGSGFFCHPMAGFYSGVCRICGGSGWKKTVYTKK